MLRCLTAIFLILFMSCALGQEHADSPLRLKPLQVDPSLNFTPVSPQTPPDEPVPKNLLEMADACLGKYKCLHQWLHAAYSVAFAKIDCFCYTGRCRPTTYKTVAVSDEYPMGVAIWANDQWCPVTAQTFRRNDARIPEILRQFKAHVCVGTNGCEHLECAILDTGG